MQTRTLAQRPTLFLAGLLLAGTLSACSVASTSTSTQVVVTEAPAATVVATTAPAATEAAQPTTVPAATEAAQPTTAPAATEAAQPTAAATDSTVAETAMTKINLNTATADQILAIPNTGQRMVREFQEYRPYTSIEQFRREIGKYVDAATVAGFEQYVYVPVDPNQADAVTLQQIPGVTEELANALIAARPFASNDAFLAKLGETLNADQVAVAKAYLQ